MCNEHRVQLETTSVFLIFSLCKPEKIADGRVNQLIAPENADYLNANLNDSFDVLGLNKDVYLVRVSLVLSRLH